MDIAPPRSREDDVNQQLEAVVLVMTPGGRGAVQHWTGTFVREPPELSVSASTDEMALSATVSGRAGPYSRVTANGVDLEADPEGRFAASIDAPIWPSQVVVTARDPLGNETTQLIEVVGVVDYRGLPWAAILIAATLVVGGVLFVRTPQRRARAPRSRRRRAPRGARARRHRGLRAARALIGYACPLDRSLAIVNSCPSQTR